MEVSVNMHDAGGAAPARNDAGHEREHGVGEHCRDREPPRHEPRQPVDKGEHVARGTALREELAHQHEERDHCEHVIADRLIGRAADEIRHHLRIVGHEIDAEHGGSAERHSDVHAAEDEGEKHAHEDQHFARAILNNQFGRAVLVVADVGDVLAVVGDRDVGHRRHGGIGFDRGLGPRRAGQPPEGQRNGQQAQPHGARCDEQTGKHDAPFPRVEQEL